MHKGCPLAHVAVSSQQCIWTTITRSMACRCISAPSCVASPCLNGMSILSQYIDYIVVRHTTPVPAGTAAATQDPAELVYVAANPE